MPASDYTQNAAGFWQKNSDGTGPYVMTAAGTFTLAATGSGSGGGGAATIADGADVAEGAIADAAITAGATGTVSAKLRSISRDVGTVAGAVSGSRVETTATPKRVRTQVTRPANQTPYSANDVVGGAIDLGVLGPASGQVMITTVMLTHEVTAVPSGMTSFRLYLYNATPPSAVADNGAFDLAAGDLGNLMGFVDLGVVNDLGSNLYCQVDNVGHQVTCDASGHLFAYLVTVGGWTPGANSTVFDIDVKTIEC